MVKLTCRASIGACLAITIGAAHADAPARPGLVRSLSHHTRATTAVRQALAEEWTARSATYADSVADAATDVPTAVYDIMAHVVVMPDGVRLEAHSGLRDRVDDPRFVAEHMRGSTPPALYELRPRKWLFHGVAALKLDPVSGEVFGRTGLLAHTYMLHGRPESNGCVVLRDYDAFLAAFREGRMKRLRVVPSVGDVGAGTGLVRAADRRA